MKQLISIALCTYNGEKFIKEQIESVLGQSYKNIELIITDDGSKDKTIEIIKQYMQLDGRITLYENKENLGFIKNFEKAISLCNGDFIALSDQDDIWKLNKIEKFVNEIKENVLIYSNATIVDETSNPTGKELIEGARHLVNGKCNKAFLLNSFISGNTMMFKQELVKYILPIPIQISYHDIWISFVASTYGTINYTDESMIYYRRHSEQVTTSSKKNYKNYLDKLRYKKEKLIQEWQTKKTNLETFKSLAILKDSDTIKIIDLLIFHFRNYQNIYFNIDLYKYLLKYKEEIFASIVFKKRNKRIFGYSMGLKFHSFTLFKIQT